MNHRKRIKDSETPWKTNGWVPFALVENEAEFETLHKYLLLVEDHIRDKTVAFASNIKKTIERLGLSGQDADYYYESHENEYGRLHEAYPNIARATVLSMACSVFESGLTEICKEFERTDDVQTTRIKWDKINNATGIIRAKKYIKKNFDIHFNEHQEWQAIRDYYKVRDCFVHANGDVSLMKEKQSKDIESITRRVPGVTIEYKRLRLDSRRFFDGVFGTMSRFWSDLRIAFRENEIVGPVYWE